jgi:uncharacterized membrane protein YeaQ/YmgE (transglycosylase-associated protein family)
MGLTSLLIFLSIGAVAGWLAGVLMKGGGFGLLGDVVVGASGAFVDGVSGDCGRTRDPSC